MSAGRRFAGIDDLGDLHGRRVLLRVDLNAPMKDGVVTDLTRLQANAVTIKALAAKGAKVIVLSHFGRPKGWDAGQSLRPVADALPVIVGLPVHFAPDCVGPVAKKAVDDLAPGGVLVLENTRFYPGEEKNDPDFARQLADLGEFFVNDAFSCAHRAHASTEGLARLLPSAAGIWMKKELDALEAALGAPERPVVAVVGGAKVSSKLEVIGNLVGKVDYLVIGGGMANTFLFANGKAIGKSLAERDMADTARAIVAKAKAAGTEVVLPVDGVVAREFKAYAPSETVSFDAVPDDAMVLDVGPRSVERVAEVFAKAKTVVWNGPFGAFEIEPFDAATNAAAREVSKLTRAGKLLSVAGGGDTVAALNHAGAAEGFSFVSTAGGAFLEWLEGKELPGVKALAR
ncbi:phosphoglycerate kinase [Zavarzinia compransoris]|uniref:Phosphoglycerate kinase n=1 Tax=Zavarzinia compransoris TaxID=1264899 RepID=A0A317E109_9PROT|nr:phosphoglycerate kinase [Zavarzinia compransoris]PWR20748.1 phosphoglycerate kinase [Zavarzinia compransoris]TDP44419.1 phosphoglycerate kinase [Zavarzinia compransoris]